MNFLDAVCHIEGEKVTLQIGESHVVTLPPAKAKKLIDGKYDGKKVVMGIRPEDIYDDEIMIANNPNSIIKSTLNVYELLGAEVFLYFDLEGTQMIARVNPRTTARPGDEVVFAMDVNKIHVFDKETECTITN